MDKAGEIGERLVAEHLVEIGYTVTARNYRTRLGEIDIVAENDMFILFVEVKTRKNNALVGGLDSVDRHKIARIQKTAALYLAEHETALQPRFDVAEVVVFSNEYRLSVYIENAF